MEIPNHAYSYPITVTAAHIDENNHVNNVVYLQWVQEVATAHWMHCSSPALREPYLWVVRRHEIDYLRPCFLGDSLVAFTWVLPPQGLSFDRMVVLMNNATQKIVMQAKTTWFMLDAGTMRTMHVPAENVSLFLQD